MRAYLPHIARERWPRKMRRHPLTRKHERTLFYLLIGTAAFNAADYMLTLLALRLGYRELNPLMDLVVHTPYFPLIKLVLIPIMLYYVWVRRHLVGRRIMLYAWIAFLVYLSLMCYFKLNVWMWVM